jgi:hypothetical protein
MKKMPFRFEAELMSKYSFDNLDTEIQYHTNHRGNYNAHHQLNLTRYCSGINQLTIIPGYDRRKMTLKTKPAQWNSELRIWQQNFGGRVKVASCINFILALPEGDLSESHVENEGNILVRHGKVVVYCIRCARDGVCLTNRFFVGI